MVSYDLAFAYMQKNEGGLVDNPQDPGGITNFGLSLRFLKSLPLSDLQKYGINYPPNADDIRSLTIDKVKPLYHDFFWSEARFAELSNQDLANYLFDASVNLGISPAIKALQRALWSALQCKDTLKDDGILGDITLNMLKDHYTISYRILSALRSERASEYRVINAQDNKPEFLAGWLDRAYRK